MTQNHLAVKLQIFSAEEVKSLPTSVLDMTQNHLVVKLQIFSAEEVKSLPTSVLDMTQNHLAVKLQIFSAEEVKSLPTSVLDMTQNHLAVKLQIWSLWECHYSKFYLTRNGSIFLVPIIGSNTLSVIWRDPIYQPLRSGRIWHKVNF